MSSTDNMNEVPKKECRICKKTTNVKFFELACCEREPSCFYCFNAMKCECRKQLLSEQCSGCNSVCNNRIPCEGCQVIFCDPKHYQTCNKCAGPIEEERRKEAIKGTKKLTSLPKKDCRICKNSHILQSFDKACCEREAPCSYCFGDMACECREKLLAEECPECNSVCKTRIPCDRCQVIFCDPEGECMCKPCTKATDEEIAKEEEEIRISQAKEEEEDKIKAAKEKKISEGWDTAKLIIDPKVPRDSTCSSCHSIIFAGTCSCCGLKVCKNCFINISCGCEDDRTCKECDLVLKRCAICFDSLCLGCEGDADNYLEICGNCTDRKVDWKDAKFVINHVPNVECSVSDCHESVDGFCSECGDSLCKKCFLNVKCACETQTGYDEGRRCATCHEGFFTENIRDADDETLCHDCNDDAEGEEPPAKKQKIEE